MMESSPVGSIRSFAHANSGAVCEFVDRASVKTAFLMQLMMPSTRLSGVVKLLA
jgi:hypothetical protein